MNISQLVLSIHQRNGGSSIELDLNQPLLSPRLTLDSLDLAEVMVAIEREMGVSPFDSSIAPKTWQDVIDFVDIALKSRSRPTTRDVGTPGSSDASTFKPETVNPRVSNR